MKKMMKKHGMGKGTAEGKKIMKNLENNVRKQSMAGKRKGTKTTKGGW